MQHITVLLSNTFPKQQLVQQLLNGNATGVLSAFNRSRVALFSTYRVQQFLEEEQRHEFSGIDEARNQSLRSMSSGEQKKALLKHLLSQNPEVLILDSPFDHLDTASQEQLRAQLETTAQHVSIVQLIHRRRDLLPFIDHRIHIADDGTERSFEEAADHLLHQSSASTIPPPLESYTIVSEELVSFRHVNVSYDGRAIVQQINWTIKAGEFWQLRGPNGSGKTTLLTMITGDNVKGYGQELYLFGKKKGSGETVWDIKNKIGYLTPAMTDLFVTRHTLLEMIVSGYKDSIGLYTLPSGLEQRTAYEWLQWLQLDQKAGKQFRDLSPGEQRMALIVRAMVKHPPLLILDEPLMDLDDHNAERVVQLINRIAAESTSAIVYVSHQTEKGLQPQQIFELTKTPNGSVGRIVTN